MLLDEYCTRVLDEWGHWAYTRGAFITSVALYAYVADSFPRHTGEVSAILNLARCLGGFCVGYFELLWGLKKEYDKSGGAQAGLAGASVIILLIFQFFGKSIRGWG